MNRKRLLHLPMVSLISVSCLIPYHSSYSKTSSPAKRSVEQSMYDDWKTRKQIWEQQQEKLRILKQSFKKKKHLRLCLKYKISFFFKGNSLTSAFKEAD
ncbi:MAG: hypothetical protein MK137_03580 [Rickettsiales bacterium]|nr:hypothetical protein [Rickettsiales bacterium]